MSSSENDTEQPARGARWLFPYLLLTAVTSGALVMVIEVLGSRVIGPFFGVSLFVWTSLITVTLIALAAGYAAGGVLADRRRSPDNLYLIILAAGVLTLFIPLLKEPVLTAAAPLGLRSGAFVSTLALFGPVLFLLGCVSPYLVRIAAREMHNIGRTVGGLYALSTAGSVVGTLLTGFMLIAYLGVNRIFQVTGALLIALAVGYFAVLRGRVLALAVLLLPVLLPMPGQFTSRVMDNGTKVTLVAGKDSFYGNLKVLDYSYGDRHTRELVIDGLIQGGVDMRNGLSIYPYSYLLSFLPYGLYPKGRRCLVLGLGAGLVPKWYESRGVRTDVVDIDPEIVELAARHFDFGISGQVAISDARYYLSTTPRRYDYVLLDVFNGDTTPTHLLSVEAMRQVKSVMTSDGVFAVNFVGSLRQRNLITASVVRTLGEAFDQVDVYPAFDTEHGEETGNLVAVAYGGAPRRFDPAVLQGEPVHPFARDTVYASLRKTWRVERGAEAIVLTDDYNPIDFYDAWLKERVRQLILRDTDWRALIR